MHKMLSNTLHALRAYFFLLLRLYVRLLLKDNWKYMTSIHFYCTISNSFFFGTVWGPAGGWFAGVCNRCCSNASPVSYYNLPALKKKKRKEKKRKKKERKSLFRICVPIYLTRRMVQYLWIKVCTRNFITLRTHITYYLFGNARFPRYICLYIKENHYMSTSNSKRSLVCHNVLSLSTFFLIILSFYALLIEFGLDFFMLVSNLLFILKSRF